MWRDECGFKHNGHSPYEQRKLAEFRLRMTIEEKYKEKEGIKSNSDFKNAFNKFLIKYCKN